MESSQVSIQLVCMLASKFAHNSKTCRSLLEYVDTQSWRVINQYSCVKWKNQIWTNYCQIVIIFDSTYWLPESFFNLQHGSKIKIIGREGMHTQKEKGHTWNKSHCCPLNGRKKDTRVKNHVKQNDNWWVSMSRKSNESSKSRNGGLNDHFNNNSNLYQQINILT